MILKKKISVDGEFAKINEDIKDGDIIKILDEGKKIEGKFGEQVVFKVETGNGEKILSFNQTTKNNLIDYLGEDTSKWVDKEVKAWVMKVSVSGKMRNAVYLSNPKAEMTEDGFIVPYDESKKDDKVVEPQTEPKALDADEITSPDDLPF